MQYEKGEKKHMSNYVLSCCSTVDLSEEHLKSRDINYIYFHFYLDSVHYFDDFGKTISYDKFYEAMENGADTSTSQINVDEYQEYFEKFLEQGKDILHVSISGGLSGSCNSANIAASELRSKYPERKIIIVDSLGASSGYGLIMDTLADLRDSGKTIEELQNWIEEHKLEMHHWFFSTDLTFYVKGGRISKASGWFGTMLKICPLLNVDKEGHLVPRKKIRGKNNVIVEIAQMMKEHARNKTDYDGKCFISHSKCIEDAKAVAKIIEESFPKLNGKVLINSIGTTIGSHSGPGTVAVFFWGDKRND